EIAYINALKTATADVPQPSYISGLPAEQQAWMRGFHEELARVAREDFGGVEGNASVGGANETATAVASATDSAAVGQTTSAPPYVVGGNGTVTAPAGNATGGGALSTTAAAPAPEQPSASASAGPGGNGTAPDTPGMAPGLKTVGVWKVAGAAAVGVLGVMVML
ncbi:MAG: hypothetical protein Q9222_006605, partial [Ikaeria aurantiellina]